VLKQGGARTFLFSGPSGTGKTTLARIVAEQLGALDCLEIDAATNSGVEDMRELSGMSRRRSLFSEKRAIMIDECHALSKSAWQSLLKILEEPVEGTYWFLCTTEPSKVPETIRTRSLHLALSSVSSDDLKMLASRVLSAENWKVNPSAVSVAVRAAAGSPRQLLVNLLLVRNCANRQEASEVVKVATRKAEVIDLCRALIQGTSPDTLWPGLMGYLSDMEKAGLSAESVRLGIFGYYYQVARSTPNSNKRQFALAVLEAFNQPILVTNGYAILVLCLGRLLYTE
jgi:DNA polymerase-3 subunit gamma/tau